MTQSKCSWIVSQLFNISRHVVRVPERQYLLVSQVIWNVAILIGHVQLVSLFRSLEAPTTLWSIVTELGILLLVSSGSRKKHWLYYDCKHYSRLSYMIVSYPLEYRAEQFRRNPTIDQSHCTISTKALDHATSQIFSLLADDTGEAGKVQSREPHCQSRGVESKSKYSHTYVFAIHWPSVDSDLLAFQGKAMNLGPKVGDWPLIGAAPLLELEKWLTRTLMRKENRS